MILVDTSIWIDHLHASEAILVSLLTDDRVATHPFVVQELALGSIRNCSTVLKLLSNLRTLIPITHAELLSYLERHRLWGRGLSAVDVQLLGSVVTTPGCKIWTRDKRLQAAATAVGAPVLRL